MRATIKALILLVTLFIIFYCASIAMGTLIDSVESQVGNMSFSPERTYDTSILDNYVIIVSVCNTIWSILAIGAVINILLIVEEQRRGYDFFERY